MRPSCSEFQGDDARHSCDGLVLFLVNAAGEVLDCNVAAEEIFQIDRNELINCHISVVLPPLAGIPMIQGGMPNSRIRFLSRVGCLFQGVARDGTRFLNELFLNVLDDNGSETVTIVLKPLPHSPDVTRKPQLNSAVQLAESM
jgi:hypothetical protein